MRLTKEQRIEIILMAGSGSSRMVALNFNRKHGTNITHDTVAKLISKFKKTGNVADQPRSGPRRTATDEDTTATILTACTESQKKHATVVCRKWCQQIECQAHFKSKQMASIQIAYGTLFE